MSGGAKPKLNKRLCDPPKPSLEISNNGMYKADLTFLLPAQSYSIKIFGVSVINYDDIMLFLYKALQCISGIANNVAFVTAFICRPPEAVTQSIFFGKN